MKEIKAESKLQYEVIKNTDISDHSLDLIPRIKRLFTLSKQRNTPFKGEGLNQIESLDTCIQFHILNAETALLQKTPPISLTKVVTKNSRMQPENSSHMLKLVSRP